MSGSRVAIVFDLDGTLIDSARVSVGILNSMLRERGVRAPINVAAVQQALSAGGEALMRHALGVSEHSVAQELGDFRQRLETLPTPPDCLYPGVVATLQVLAARGVPLAICTKKPERLTLKVLRELELLGLFAAVSGGDSLPFSKPDPRHLMAVVDALHSTPAQVLYVGDSHFDAQMARAADVRFAFATYGYDDGRVEAAACFAAVDTIDQILPLVARMHAGVASPALSANPP
jgi:phosphoglycolate phosphatase